MMNALTKKRIESIRKELQRRANPPEPAMSARYTSARNIAGERAVNTLGVDRATELLAMADSGDDDAVSALMAAC